MMIDVYDDDVYDDDVYDDDSTFFALIYITPFLFESV